jgi:hypothetical protein
MFPLNVYRKEIYISDVVQEIKHIFYDRYTFFVNLKVSKINLRKLCYEYNFEAAYSTVNHGLLNAISINV